MLLFPNRQVAVEANLFKLGKSNARAALDRLIAVKMGDSPCLSCPYKKVVEGENMARGALYLGVKCGWDTDMVSGKAICPAMKGAWNEPDPTSTLDEAPSGHRAEWQSNPVFSQDGSNTSINTEMHEANVKRDLERAGHLCSDCDKVREQHTNLTRDERIAYCGTESGHCENRTVLRERLARKSGFSVDEWGNATFSGRIDAVEVETVREPEEAPYDEEVFGVF